MEDGLPLSNPAAEYDIPAHSRVTVTPHCIAMTTASTDPSTLAEAFTAHAHSTAAPWLSRSSRKPVGNGTPISSAPGPISSRLTSNFSQSLLPRNVLNAIGNTN